MFRKLLIRRSGKSISDSLLRLTSTFRGSPRLCGLAIWPRNATVAPRDRAATFL
jgi:hypothetical protein